MNQYQSENITELAKSLLNVQRTVQPFLKDAENPFTTSWYASLNSVMDACRDALIENGIWLCQYPVPVERPNSIGLVTKLTYAESGQWQKLSCRGSFTQGRSAGHGIGNYCNCP